ncbi:MAG: Txe/YoeB family addiction module toxin [Prevotellaceae bacterium]|jgi:toxin YoeB|nr:Txe/YoeB family addiction module toxin [Prevotellaceae bacterium]
MYIVKLTERAEEDLLLLEKSEPKSFNKAEKLLNELIEYPTTGTGKPEQLKFQNYNIWSRRITKKHRLVYSVENRCVTVLVLSAYGHYKDK